MREKGERVCTLVSCSEVCCGGSRTKEKGRREVSSPVGEKVVEGGKRKRRKVTSFLVPWLDGCGGRYGSRVQGRRVWWAFYMAYGRTGTEGEKTPESAQLPCWTDRPVASASVGRRRGEGDVMAICVMELGGGGRRLRQTERKGADGREGRGERRGHHRKREERRPEMMSAPSKDHPIYYLHVWSKIRHVHYCTVYLQR